MFKKFCALSVMAVTAAYGMNKLHVRYAEIGSKTYVIQVDDTTTAADVIKKCCEMGYNKKGELVLVLTRPEQGPFNSLFLKDIKSLKNDENIKSNISAHSTAMADLAYYDENGDLCMPF